MFIPSYQPLTACVLSGARTLWCYIGRWYFREWKPASTFTRLQTVQRSAAWKLSEYFWRPLKPLRFTLQDFHRSCVFLFLNMETFCTIKHNNVCLVSADLHHLILSEDEFNLPDQWSIAVQNDSVCSETRKLIKGTEKENRETTESVTAGPKRCFTSTFCSYWDFFQECREHYLVHTKTISCELL